MAENSTIEWTDATWNPVTGCTKISPGCAHCYAETFAERFRGVKGHPYEQGFDLKLWPDRIELPLRWKKPRRIFVNSMSDLFHKDIPDDFIRRVFVTMERASHHTFQVLTKRANRLEQWTNENYTRSAWPKNVWLGVSVENQDYSWRIAHLQHTPAALRFLSIEPLLGPLKLNKTVLRGIQWVIVGGESGPGARKMERVWVESVRCQSAAAGVLFFFKQWGGVQKSRNGRVLNGRTYDEIPLS